MMSTVSTLNHASQSHTLCHSHAPSPRYWSEVETVPLATQQAATTLLQKLVPLIWS